MTSKEDLSNIVREKLDEIISGINAALRGRDNLNAIRPTLERNGRGGKVPHWFNVLSSNGTLPTSMERALEA